MSSASFGCGHLAPVLTTPEPRSALATTGATGAPPGVETVKLSNSTRAEVSLGEQARTPTCEPPSGAWPVISLLNCCPLTKKRALLPAVTTRRVLSWLAAAWIAEKSVQATWASHLPFCRRQTEAWPSVVTCSE